MSVLVSDLYTYGCANMPDVDGSTVGGALNSAILVVFSDISPTGTMDYVSSAAADTGTTIQVYGRDSTGVIQNETKTLTGTTTVAGAQSFQRLLKGLVGGTGPTGDVASISHTVVCTGTAQGAANATTSVPANITLAAGQGTSTAIGQIVRITNNTPSGVNFQLRRIVSIATDVISVNRNWGTVPSSASVYNVHEGMLFDILPNPVTQCRRPFYNSSADVPGGSQKIYYEKIFVVNNNTTTALTGASVIIQAETGALPGTSALDIALTTALNDTAGVANRQTTVSSGITSFSSGTAPQTITVPAPGNLPSGAAPNATGAQGVWLRLTLPAGTASYNGNFTLRTQGTTVALNSGMFGGSMYVNDGERVDVDGCMVVGHGMKVW